MLYGSFASPCNTFRVGARDLLCVTLGHNLAMFQPYYAITHFLNLISHMRHKNDRLVAGNTALHSGQRLPSKMGIAYA